MLKLTLNYDALSKLIKDSGEEFKLELKAGILKSAINHAFAMTVQENRDFILRNINVRMEKEVNCNTYSFQDIKFTKKFEYRIEEAIKHQAEVAFDNILSSYLDKKFEEYKRVELKEVDEIFEQKKKIFEECVEKYINRIIDDSMISFIKSRINSRFNEKLEKLENNS